MFRDQGRPQFMLGRTLPPARNHRSRLFYGRHFLRSPFTAGCSASHRGLGPAQRTAGPVQKASRSLLHGGQRAAPSPIHRGLGPAQRTEGCSITLTQRPHACTKGLAHCFCHRGLIGRAHSASIAPTPRSPLANVTEDCFAPRAEGCPLPQRRP